jgi:hypothetical protein
MLLPGKIYVTTSSIFIHSNNSPYSGRLNIYEALPAIKILTYKTAAQDYL